MSKFTYESGNRTNALEAYEWDNVWWEQTENQTAKRILYIGDSISCGTRHAITKLTESAVLCDGFGTSKALDNPCFKPAVELFMAQQSRCDLILFNNGLHGWHLTEEEYGKHYEEMLKFLLKAEKKLFVLLTTDDMSSPDHNERAGARNEMAKALAEKYSLPVIDLHTVAVNNPQYHTGDGVHFTAEGYELLAKCILEKIL